MAIGLINDFPDATGAGKYGLILHDLLAGDLAMEYLYLDAGNLAILRRTGGSYSTLAALPRIPGLGGFKPWFWLMAKYRLPAYQLCHLLTPNISFIYDRGPYIVTCHDIAPLFMPISPAERLGRQCLYSGLARASHLIADSEATKNDIIRAYRIPSSRITVIPLGVDGRIFRPGDRSEARTALELPQGDSIILNVAIDMWRKNLAGAIRAFSRILARRTNALLVLTSQPKKQTWQSIQRLGLAERVVVKDRLTEPELARLYRAADVLLFPSFYEGFGLPALEAMASGCPVVASNATSLPEVVGQAGLMREPGDIEGLAESVLELLEDGRLYQRLVDRGLRRASEFTWERTARETATVYKNVMAKA